MLGLRFSNLIFVLHHNSEIPIILNRLSKLILEYCLFNFIFYMKHNDVTMYDAFMWNWLKFTLFDDALFITTCINYALVDEIWWAPHKERVTLGTICKNCQGVLSSLMTFWLRSISLGRMKHMVHVLMGEKNLSHEWHGHFGPSWVIHLHRH
jgi:hypothetical protein